jgi:hypothetical protein
MPGKKTTLPEPSENARVTAPALSKTLAKQVKIDSQSTSSDTTAHSITVRKTPATKAANPDPPEAVPTPTQTPGNIDNAETDKAVDDIMAQESDMVLAVDDIMRAKRSQPSSSQSGWKDKLRSILHNKWTWIGVALILCILFAVPYTRYKLLGVVLKEQVHVTVIDSQNDTPVSNALVSVAGKSVKTDANGKAELSVGLGERTLAISKQYYRTADTHYFVGFKSKTPITVKLVATGRLVPITVLNTISGQPLPGAVIHILGTTAKTNAKGQTGVAIPATVKADVATISLAGYNTKKVSVQVTAQAVAGNSFTLTPVGTIAYLAKQGTSINVLKANLDGSNVQTVLAGSGHETASTTRLLASADWHYLVLEANRDGTRPALYLINTATDQITEFDSSNATFNLIGWSGHNFLYSLNNTSESQWQSGTQLVKDYNADQHQINQLDQNQAVGDSSSYAYQSFANFFITGDALVYSTQWTAQGGYDQSSENDTIRAFQLSSQSLKNYESFPAATTGTISSNQYQPQVIYFAVPSTTASTAYYQYNNQNVQSASIDQPIFNQTNPTYLLSPSGSHNLWSSLSHGQDLFFVGDSNAASQQQIAALDNYSPYGWYSDSYILASRDNDQLYILPASGLSGAGQPLKITTYYEPAAPSGYEYGGF